MGEARRQIRWAIYGGIAVAAGIALLSAANMVGSTRGTGLRDNVANGQVGRWDRHDRQACLLYTSNSPKRSSPCSALQQDRANAESPISLDDRGEAARQAAGEQEQTEGRVSAQEGRRSPCFDYGQGKSTPLLTHTALSAIMRTHF